MRYAVFSFLAIILFGSGAYALAPETHAQLPSINATMNYRSVRHDLIAHGYKPIVFQPHSHKPGCDRYPEICAAYKEVDFCSDVGETPCVFFWRDPHGTPFSITTTTAEHFDTTKTLTIYGAFDLHSEDVRLIQENDAKLNNKPLGN